MGRRHQQASRMQARGAGGRSGISSRFAFPLLDNLVMRPHFAVISLAVLCIVVSAGLIYPEAQQYYLQMRTNDQAAAEYQAVIDRNGELAQRVASLQTDEGMEELAHESLGWVREGEHAVSVVADGSSDTGSAATDQTGSIAAGSVPAPETWYSPVLDAVFGYGG